MKYVLDILDFAMTMEQEGKFFFSEWSGRVGSAVTKEIFQELARWEEEHWQYLARQRSSLERTGKIIPADATVAQAEEKALATFYDRGRGESSRTEVTRCMSDMTALRLAITIEHDLHEFYGNAAGQAQDADLKEVFDSLSKWELRHREILEQEYGLLKEKFWSEMKFYPF
ncbi:MAG: ferritin family protein [Negativicutes bacterium]|nr:ferritin family protein [Negativicutes bacterium]